MPQNAEGPQTKGESKRETQKYLLGLNAEGAKLFSKHYIFGALNT